MNPKQTWCLLWWGMWSNKAGCPLTDESQKTPGSRANLPQISVERPDTWYIGSLKSDNRLPSAQWDCWGLGCSLFSVSTNSSRTFQRKIRIGWTLEGWNKKMLNFKFNFICYYYTQKLTQVLRTCDRKTRYNILEMTKVIQDFGVQCCM